MTTPRPVVADSSPPSPPLGAAAGVLAPRAPAEARAFGVDRPRVALAREHLRQVFFRRPVRSSRARTRDSPSSPRSFARILVLALAGGEITLSEITLRALGVSPQPVRPEQEENRLPTAVATNNLKRKVEAANIFGFVEDKQGNSAATVNPTGTSRTVLSGLDAPFPPARPR